MYALHSQGRGLLVTYKAFERGDMHVSVCVSVCVSVSVSVCLCVGGQK